MYLVDHADPINPVQKKGLMTSWVVWPGPAEAGCPRFSNQWIELDSFQRGMIISFQIANVLNRTMPHLFLKQSRWFRVDLKTLLVMTILASFVLASFYSFNRKQRLAVRTFEKNGWQFTFEHEISDCAPPGPAWVRYFVGDNYFANVVEVVIWHEKGFELLNDFPELRSVTCAGKKADFEALANLPNLKHLVIGDADPLTSDCVTEISGLDNLTSLEIHNERLPNDMNCLSNLQNLEHIFFCEYSFSDSPRAFDFICKMKNLKTAVLPSSVSDTTLKQIVLSCKNKDLQITKHFEKRAGEN